MRLQQAQASHALQRAAIDGLHHGAARGIFRNAEVLHGLVAHDHRQAFALRAVAPVGIVELDCETMRARTQALLGIGIAHQRRLVLPVDVDIDRQIDLGRRATSAEEHHTHGRGRNVTHGVRR